MRGWRAWYADRSVYTSTETAWRDLPPEGMLGVVVYWTPPYKSVIQTRDWWWIDDDGAIQGVPTHPEWGRWAEPPDAPPEMVKKGAGVSGDIWRAVQAEMMESTWP